MAQEGTTVIPTHTEVTADRELMLPGACPRVSQILARIGDKWTMLAVMLLGEGPLRFSALKRTIGGVSQRMLTLTLRNLERDGLVTRTVLPTNPPQVQYELTRSGHSLKAPVKALGMWAHSNAEAIETSRQRFDKKHVA